MEKSEFYSIKEFDYIIDSTGIINYNEQLTSLLSRIESTKKEIDLLSELIKLCDLEMDKSNDYKDYNTLASDKNYFINCLIRYKNRLNNHEKELNRFVNKKQNYDKFITEVNYYNDNISKVNEIIRKYNDDIIYNSDDTVDLEFIEKFKNSIKYIIDYAKYGINFNCDLKLLSGELKKLCIIEDYYNNAINKKKEIINRESLNNNEVSGFLFGSSTRINESMDSNTQVTENKYDDSSLPNDFIFDMDYTASNKKSHKIKRIKKSSRWGKIKNSLKKNSKKIIACLLIGVTMIGLSGFAVGEGRGDLINTKNDSSFDVVLNQTEPTTDSVKIKENKVIENSVETKREIKKNVSKASDSINDITIGTKVSVDGNIYINATNAYNKEDSMKPYYSLDDKREVSLIYYSNNDGDTVVVSKDNKDRINELKNLKYEVVSYCTNNIDNNVEYEGWFNTSDVKMLVK